MDISKESFNQYFVSVFTPYVNFDGRVAKKPFWMFVLYNFLVSLAIALVGNILKTGILASLFSLAVFIPSLGLSVRRLHDLGKGWTWLLIGLIPLVGWIVLIYYYIQDGEAGDNMYGPVP